METREKILLLLCFCAVAYGAYYFLVEAPREEGIVQDAGSDAVALEKKVAAVQAEIAACAVPETQSTIMNRTVSAWTADPFFKGKLPSEIAAEKAAAEAAAIARTAANRKASELEQQRLAEVLSWEREIIGRFVYTGFATMGSERLAVINGIEYRIGEEPPPGGCIIEKINLDSVVLRRKDGDNTVTVKILE